MTVTSCFVMPVPTMKSSTAGSISASGCRHAKKRVSEDGSVVQPYVLVKIEEHAYSLIGFTKLVMNVTFK